MQLESERKAQQEAERNAWVETERQMWLKERQQDALLDDQWDRAHEGEHNMRLEVERRRRVHAEENAHVDQQSSRLDQQPSTSTFGTGRSSHVQPQSSQSSLQTSSSGSGSNTPYATPKTSFTNARSSVNSRTPSVNVRSREPPPPPVPLMPAALARRVSTASSDSSASNIFISPEPRGPRPRMSVVSIADTHTTDESALDVGERYISWADKHSGEMPYAHFVGRAPGGGRYAAFGAFAALEADSDDMRIPLHTPESSGLESSVPSQSSSPPSQSSSTATLPSLAKQPAPRSVSSGTSMGSVGSENLPAPPTSQKYPATPSSSNKYPAPSSQPTPAFDVHRRETEVYRAQSAESSFTDRVIPPAVPAKDASDVRVPANGPPFAKGSPVVAWERMKPDGDWESVKPSSDWGSATSSSATSSFIDEAHDAARRKHGAFAGHPEYVAGHPPSFAGHSGAFASQSGYVESSDGWSPEDWARLRDQFPEYVARMQFLQERGYDYVDEDDDPEAPYGYPGMPMPYPPSDDYPYGPPPMEDDRAYFNGWSTGANRTLSAIIEESLEHLPSGLPGHSDIGSIGRRSFTDTDEMLRRKATGSTMTLSTSDARTSFAESMPSSMRAIKSIPSRSTIDQTPRTIPSSDSLWSDAQSVARGVPESSSSSDPLPSTPRLTVPSSMPSTSSLATPETTPRTDRSPGPREKHLVRDNSATGSAELGFGHLFVARPQTLLSSQASTRDSGPTEDWRDSRMIDLDRWLPDELGSNAPTRAISPTPVLQKTTPNKAQRPALQTTPAKMQPTASKASSSQSTPTRSAAMREYYRSQYGEELQTLVSSDDESDIVLHPRRPVIPPTSQASSRKPAPSPQKGKQPQITPQSSSSTDTGYEPLTDSGLSIDDVRNRRTKGANGDTSSRSQPSDAVDWRASRDRDATSSRTATSKPVIPYTSRSQHGYAPYSHAQESSTGSRAGATDVESEYSSHSYSKLPPRPVAPIPSTTASESNASVGRPKTPSALRPKTPSRSRTPAPSEVPSRSKTPVGKSKSSKAVKTESEVEWYSLHHSTSSLSAQRTSSPAPQSEKSHGRSEKSRSDKSTTRAEPSPLRPRPERPDSRASRGQEKAGKTKSRVLDDGTEITTSYQRLTQDMLDRFMPQTSSSSDERPSTSLSTQSRSTEAGRSRDKGKTSSVAAPTPRRVDAPSTPSRSSTPSTRAKTPTNARSSTPSTRAGTPKAVKPASSTSRTAQPSNSTRTSQSSSSTRKKERPVPVPGVPPVPVIPLAAQAAANAHAARASSRMALVPPNSQAPVIPRGAHIPRSASSAGYAASSSSVSEY
ncbi:hypothetical protein BD626DRAFT_522955 [Schizophyllum amplum]|uniref:Uncharacterized protein n=1 Tax=Schizophyllum amplum TaxID=97359 RepID=A0A550BT86_9AGAR|nr:hypothetical protein BD626DRAFT_522955 [Auriculariopsis ampla]